MDISNKTHRLFFALWPTDQVRLSIINEFYGLPQQEGIVIDPANVHLTLHFLGVVDESSAACLHAEAQALNAQKFCLDLDTFGHFDKTKIFWMGAGIVPDQLTNLHRMLEIVLMNCGYKAESRRYTPHVTLMRNYQQLDFSQSDFSIHWKIDDFSLVESIRDTNGVTYKVIARYPMQ